MGLYARFLLPKIVDFTCGTKPCMRQRAKVVPSALGNVLEIGFGSGWNLPFYDKTRVRRVWALDPSRELWALAAKRVRCADFPVDFLEASAEEIPLPDGSADTVLMTFALCTVPDVSRALREMARVLKPGGELVFSEHGLAPDENVRRWQNRLNPIWNAFSGGCHLNRPIPFLLEEGGFRLRNLSSMYLPGWRPASFTYWGRASAMP
jgi:SAM-dependent methyltransferase